MGLSEEDRKRIEEEEFRRALREKYDRELRISADVRADTSHQVEVRGLSTEIYRDIKRALRGIVRFIPVLLFWLWMLMLAVYGVIMPAGFAVLSIAGKVPDAPPWWAILPISPVGILLFVMSLRGWLRKRRQRATSRLDNPSKVRN